MTSTTPFTLPKLRTRWLRPVLNVAAGLPPLRALAQAAYTSYFNRAAGNDVRLFRGIFADFASAARAVPSGRLEGYDNAASAQRNVGEWMSISEYDYPVMFWLEKLLPACRFVFDWGGNVGLKYFAYRPYLSYPSGLRWCVSEVPAVAAAGEAIARRESATALDFTTTLDELPRADLLLAAGALHFIEDPFGMLRALHGLPPHLLFCKVPVYDRPAAVTLQNMGTSLCPNHLFNRDEFIANVTALGYRLVDEWRSTDCSCTIPFYPDHSIGAYSGFYFTRSE